MEKSRDFLEGVKNKNGLENIEAQVNYTENHSTLLFSRLLNPNIRNQLLEVFEENEKYLAEKSRQPYTKEVYQDPVTGEYFFDEEGNFDFREVTVLDDEYAPKTREQLEEDLDNALMSQMMSTNIDFDLLLGESNAKTANYNDEADIGENPISEALPTERVTTVGLKRDNQGPLSQKDVQNYSMTEAHEKGHALRVMKRSEYLYNLFSPAFNTGAIDDNILLEQIKQNLETEDISSEELRYAKEAHFEEYLFDFAMPTEIYERMSQLKGYFSMRGDEEFTKEHLDYARKHYLRDGMLDNNMTEFFQAITPETEPHFLKLINSVGV